MRSWLPTTTVGRRSSNYRPELREQAVRMVAEVWPEYPSDWPTICAVAVKLGIRSAETLRKWVRQSEVDAGTRPASPVRSRRRSSGRSGRTPSCAGRTGEILKGGVGFLRGGARPPTEALAGTIRDRRMPVTYRPHHTE